MLKTKFIIRLCAGTLAAFLLSGCSSVRYSAPEQTNCSTKGTPVLTRQKANAVGVRFFFLGADPSMEEAFEKLYSGVGKSGYRIVGNNYAFQNIISEERRFLLYPFLGWSNLSVSADLYAYIPENSSTESGE